MSEETSKPQDEVKPELTKKEKFKKEAKSIFWIILLVFGFRSTFFEPFKIPSGSMIPTLLIGDFILVNKFSYGFKVPFTDMFGDPVYITGPDKPERGDVIVFKYPRDPDINFIKRVVGLPGDKIHIIDKRVYVNDEPIDMDVMDGKEIMDDMDEKYKEYNFKFYKTETGDHTHVVQTHEDNHFNAHFPPRVVPQDMYFVMGDNRDFSADSRAWGFVPFGHIKGRALFVWFSFSMDMPWSHQDETWMFRPWRIGTVIDDAPGLDD